MCIQTSFLFFLEEGIFIVSSSYLLNLIFNKIYVIIYIESEESKMFDDFDTMQQSDEIIPEEYEDWLRWMYNQE